MVDYITIVLTGTATGIGIIIANRIASWFDRRRDKIKNLININNLKNE